MSAIPGVRVIPRERRADARGWLLKVLTGAEPDLGNRVGEIYLVRAEPGGVRGNHYHRCTAEWFTVLEGAADLYLRDEATGARDVIRLTSETPVTIHVSAGIAHAFHNPASDAGMLLIAYANAPYDPADTIPADIVPAEARASARETLSPGKVR